MSLKAFHVIFIGASCALAFGCTAWCVHNGLGADGSWRDWAYAAGAFAAGVGLIVYERFFLKKLRDVSYL